MADPLRSSLIVVSKPSTLLRGFDCVARPGGGSVLFLLCVFFFSLEFGVIVGGVGEQKAACGAIKKRRSLEFCWGSVSAPSCDKAALSAEWIRRRKKASVAPYIQHWQVSDA